MGGKTANTTKGGNDLKKRGKNYQEAIKLVDPTKIYDITEAIEILKVKYASGEITEEEYKHRLKNIE